MKNKYLYLALLGLLSSGAVQANQIRIESDKKIDIILSVDGQKDQKLAVSEDKPQTLDMPWKKLQITESKLLGIGARMCASFDPQAYYGMGGRGKTTVTFSFTKDGCSDDR